MNEKKNYLNITCVKKFDQDTLSASFFCPEFNVKCLQGFMSKPAITLLQKLIDKKPAEVSCDVCSKKVKFSDAEVCNDCLKVLDKGCASNSENNIFYCEECAMNGIPT